MKALTVYQPWASLIAVGAKPYEFRGWDFTARPGLAKLVGQRIAIHASARAIDLGEVIDILSRIRKGTSALVPDLATPMLERLRDAHKSALGNILPLSAVVATATLGKPVPVGVLFADTADSDRLDHSKFGWPLTDVVRLDVPVHFRGAQGFWHFPEALAA